MRRAWASFYECFLLLVAYGFTIWGLQHFLLNLEAL